MWDGNPPVGTSTVWFYPNWSGTPAVRDAVSRGVIDPVNVRYYDADGVNLGPNPADPRQVARIWMEFRVRDRGRSFPTTSTITLRTLGKPCSGDGVNPCTGSGAVHGWGMGL